jgi:glutaminyl-tRNA synthetase
MPLVALRTATRRGCARRPEGQSDAHWVSAAQAADVEVRLYGTLFTGRDPDDIPEGVDYKSSLNPKSLEIVPAAKVEPGLKDAAPGSRWQFERLGYFCVDTRYSQPGRPVFNRTVTLKDEWARIVSAGQDK